MQHLHQFKGSAKEVIWHIPSKFTDEISRKSEVVRYSELLCI